MAKAGEKRWADRIVEVSRRAISRTFADLLRPGTGAVILGPDLPEADLPRLKERIEECLDARGGAASARARAAELGRTYLGLDEHGRRRFLKLLGREYGPGREAIQAAAGRLAQADVKAFPAACQAMSDALVTPRLKLLRQFNGLEQGVKFLVDVRADLLAQKRGDADLTAFEAELHDLLASWFDVGFLALTHITWDAPAALLEKLVAYEAVHEIRSWDDLKNRLEADRRCYAFFHPNMPGEPLIFVEVALVNGLAASVQALLDETAPAKEPGRADTAIFYSISNAQKGLQGVPLGDFLIKRVVDTLAHDLPNLKTFATLSPIPGLRRWLDGQIKAGTLPLTADDADILTAIAHLDDPVRAFAALLEKPDWPNDPTIAIPLSPIVTRLGARYLVTEKRGGGVPKALDPVAHFHLSNGARVERLNWMGDTSKNGLSQSLGLMVNYLYRLGDIEANHERYRAEGRIATSSALQKLL